MFGKVKSLIINRMRKEVKTPVFIKTTKDQFLVGRRALITGGNSGIGLSIAKCFVEAGANAIITGRDEEKLMASQKIINQIRSDSCETFVMDMERVDMFETVFSNMIQNKNKIDILVNNAGIRSKEKFNNISEDEFDKIIATNLKGVVFLSQVVSSYMIKNNIRGNILNISSSSAVRPANTAYTLSKWALRGFTIGMARELLPYGIVVNAVAPGPCATKMLGIDENEIDISWNSNPSNRLVTPEEIAEISKMLVSESGRMIVGDTIYVTGGGAITTIDDVK